MNLGVIAAGVETEEQFRLLKAKGCRQGQGFLFSLPLPAEQLARLLDRSRQG
jgi:EAL domain-containing protein (putative c-di-GMP-specific phosphodiesterase class I)